MMLRAEIEEKYQWDLSTMYDSDEAWEQEYQKVKQTFSEIKVYQGKILDHLSKFTKTSEKLQRSLHNLYAYASMKLDENTKNAAAQDRMSRMGSLAAEVQASASFVSPELLSHDKKEVMEILEKEGMQQYKKYYEDMFRFKPHTLSQEVENILAMGAELAEAPSGAFGMLSNADMVFEDAIDAEGNAHKLTNGSYRVLMESPDRTLREDAYHKFYAEYKKHINTMASLMQSEVKKNIYYAKVRGYASAREAALFENNISIDVPDRLFDAVHANISSYHQAMAIRKRVLGLENMKVYDMSVPLVKSTAFNIPFEQARTTVLEAFKPLGEEYVNTVRGGFESRWIDVYETEGKRSGAYSGGTYDSPPFILLNHHDNLNSMFTLAHELGHSMHSHYTMKTQPYVYANYSIFVAEVASTTNEALLNDYLLKNETDEEKKKYILNHYIDQFRGTLFRQAQFAEFERDIHAYVEQGGALTAEYLCEHYLEILKKYYGDNVTLDEYAGYEWARIPHFYYNFYVYQYATGFSAAIAFAKEILEGNKEKYMGFLSAGSSDYPVNVLRTAGVDMETEEPVNNALTVFKNTVQEFDKLL